MSEIIERDGKGRFLTGGKPGPGRPRGSRNRLGEDFLRDLADAWASYGADALAKCATEEPAQFVRVVAGLLPREAVVDVNITRDVESVLTAFRAAASVLGVDPARGLRHLRRLPAEILNADD